MYLNPITLVSRHEGDGGIKLSLNFKEIFFLICVQTGSGAQPASCTMGTGGPFPGAKAWLGRDADHSPPSSADVENK
jgi:hypothetical protein